MIPVFPTFKILTLRDKKAVTAITEKFPPYSDFNFTSLWSWNTDRTIKISTLYGNLVVLFSDYITNEPYLSFIGETRILETTFLLLEYSKKNFGKAYLKLVPEEFVSHFRASPTLHITHDRGDADYVYLAEHLARMDTWRAKSKGKLLRKHIAQFPPYEVRCIPIQDISDKDYKRLFHAWSIQKYNNRAYDLNEFKAFKRFMRLSDKNIICIAIYIKEELAGFSMYELLPHNYAIAHFSKANTKKYPGIYEILNWEEGRVLHARGTQFLNWEQDLGIAGLRHTKETYKPLFLLKKIIVTLS